MRTRTANCLPRNAACMTSSWVRSALHKPFGTDAQRCNTVNTHPNQGNARIRGVAPAGGSSSLASFPTLRAYGRDLTFDALCGHLDPLLGREDVLTRTMQVLLRRSKNNPVLVGDPGVGKTAVVEGLAQYMASPAAPDRLQRCRIVSLDVASLLAGTQYRGAFEERIQKLLREVRSARGNIILFIDELHMIVGAGQVEGSLDAANILKPSLARGELHLIGATTYEEYRQHVEQDGALARRFQAVHVEEPTEEEAVAWLQGLKPKYEAYHGVHIQAAAVEAAVRAAHRYITDRRLPDSAIDLLDEAAAIKVLQSAASRSSGNTVLFNTSDTSPLHDSSQPSQQPQHAEAARIFKEGLNHWRDSAAAGQNDFIDFQRVIDSHVHTQGQQQQQSSIGTGRPSHGPKDEVQSALLHHGWRPEGSAQRPGWAAGKSQDLPDLPVLHDTGRSSELHDRGSRQHAQTAWPCPHCGLAVTVQAGASHIRCSRCGTSFLNVPPEKLLLGTTVAGPSQGPFAGPKGGSPTGNPSKHHSVVSNRASQDALSEERLPDSALKMRTEGTAPAAALPSRTGAGEQCQNQQQAAHAHRPVGQHSSSMSMNAVHEISAQDTRVEYKAGQEDSGSRSTLAPSSPGAGYGSRDQAVTNSNEAQHTVRQTAARGVQIPVVEPLDVVQVLSTSRGIAVDAVSAVLPPGASAAAFPATALAARLAAAVPQQEEAARTIARLIQLADLGWTDGHVPRVRALLQGHHGADPMQLAAAVARVALGDERALFTIHCSQMMEKTSVTRLLGAPPGYIGYGQAGLLTETVGRRPYCCVVFEDADLAHFEVQSLIAQALRLGELLDSSNRKVNFRQAVVLLTVQESRSTVPPTALHATSPNLPSHAHGPPSAHSKATAAAMTVDEGATQPGPATGAQKPPTTRRRGLDMLVPEILSHIDEVITLKQLDNSMAQTLVQDHLRELVQRLHFLGVSLTIDPAVEDALLSARLGGGPAVVAGVSGSTAQQLERQLRRLVLEPVVAQLEKCYASTAAKSKPDVSMHIAVTSDGAVTVQQTEPKR